jgi:hypothetical protein
VWLAAGGRCTFCNKDLVKDDVTGQEVLIGQLAHIVGWSTAAGSPRGAWRELLAMAESDHPGVESIALFPAVPAVGAVVMGRALMRGGHPALRIYDLSHRTRRYETS